MRPLHVTFSIGNTMSKLDLAVLADPGSRAFTKELASAHLKLQSQQELKFFERLVSHFDSNLAPETGNEILLCLCRVLYDRSHCRAFVSGEFAESLPFDSPELAPQLFDLMFLLAQNCPAALTPTVAKGFRSMIRYDAQKALVVLAVYADRFEEVDNPWPMLDILVTRSAQFQTPELVENYISLLQYLCRRFPDYRKARGDACWRRVCGVLALKNEVIVTTAYYGLCAIAEACSNVGLGDTFPMEWILKHIKKVALQPPIVSLLLRLQPPSNAPGTEQLVSALVRIAEATEKGCYILMKMAKDSHIAQLLLRNPAWMRRRLPNLVNTLGLFTVVMEHVSLRTQVVQKEETVALLKELAMDSSCEYLLGVCQLIRRLPLTPAFVTKLSESGMLREYATTMGNASGENFTHSALLLYDCLARVQYVKDFDDACDFVSHVTLKRNPQNKDLPVIAARVAVTLSVYPTCALRLEPKLRKFFAKRQDDDVVRKFAARFERRCARAHAELDEEC